MGELQTRLYKNFIESDSIKRSMEGIYYNVFILNDNITILNANKTYEFYIHTETDNPKKGNSLSALAAITLLKKLCNHPDLIYDKIIEKTEGFEKAAKLLPSDYSRK